MKILTVLLFVLLLPLLSLGYFVMLNARTVPYVEQKAADITPLPVSDSGKSIYGELTPGDTDTFALLLEKGRSLQFSLRMPNDDLSHIRQPEATLFADRIGELAFEPSRAAAVKQDPYSLHDWVMVGTLTFEVPETAVYHVRVSDLFSEQGIYAIEISGGELHRAADLLRVATLGPRVLFAY